MASHPMDIGECAFSPEPDDVGETKSTTVTADVMSLSCRFCLNVDDNLTTPKALPCSHVFCLPCLTTDREKNKITKCPICRHVTDMSVDELPSVVKGEYKLLCDICVHDGVHDQYSKVYCTECATKFCKKHELMHEEIHRSHDGHMIGMDDYKLRSRELEIRKCTEHANSALNAGCRKCLKVICTDCLHADDFCSDGSCHDFIPLGMLVVDLHTVIDPLREKAKEKDRQISELVKTTSVILSVWDSETEEMIKTLHKTRDEQIEAIKQEYTKIETELRANRDKAKDDITKYLDEEAGVKMDKLQTELLLFDAKLKDVHMVDLVTHHNQLEKKLRDLIGEGFPSLVLKNQLKLSTCDSQGMKRTSRIAEIDLVAGDDYRISVDLLPPKQIKLMREVTLESECITVCSYRGIVYVGLKNGSVIRIGSSGEKSLFVKLENQVSSVRGNNRKIYVLTSTGYETPYLVSVYNLEGHKIESWRHSKASCYSEGNKFAFNGDTVTIIDQASRKLSVYSQTGKLKYEKDCPHLRSAGDGEVVICSGLSGSVIVSHMDGDEVFQLNMKTGEEEWMCKSVITDPQGVARYGEKYLIVTNKRSDRTEIWILDIKTGEVIGTIRDDKRQSIGSRTYDLFIDGDILIIPRYDVKKVLFYNLE